MDTATFLAHIVAPGSYLVVCYKGVDSELMGTRFFPRDETKNAAGFIRWCVNRQMDVWYAVASYKTAIVTDKRNVDGTFQLKGSRAHDNVELIKCLWYDADIKRPGDNKKPEDCFATHAELKHWVDHTLTPNFYPPDMWVCSGYGAHIYWIFDEPMPLLEWQNFADAFKLFLADNGGRGDIGITADASRILRPPNTSNFKVPAQPAPVTVEYANLC